MTKANRALVVHLATLLLTIAGLIALARFFPLAEKIAALQTTLATKPLLGAILHPLLFALCNIFLLPGGLLAMSGGLFFGVWKGWLLNLIGSVLSAWVAILIARHGARGLIERRFLTQPRWASLDAAIARDGWRVVFLTQLHPLAPSSLLNYLYGATRIPIAQSLLWTALGQAPGLLLYAYLGSISHTGIEAASGHTTIGTSDWAIWAAILVSSVVILTLLARLSRRILSQSSGLDELNDE